MNASEKNLLVLGAREHNLKNINVEIPRNKLIVITGVSGSGKSSLAFDTIYAEGQRRYVESLSAYARQFLGRMEKPDVDSIEGLSPSISIDQKGVSKNPRSTVGTVTEIYDYFRLMFARAGRMHCYKCDRRVEKQSVQQIVDSIFKFKENTKFLVLAPIIKHMRGEHIQVLEQIRKDGFVRVRINGNIHDLSEEIKLDRYKWHTIETVVDRLIINNNLEKERLSESIETALNISKGYVLISSLKNGEKNYKDIPYSEEYACLNCDISIEPLEPRNFSFNTPYGACKRCTGLGFKFEIDPDLIISNQELTINNGAINPWSRNGKNSPVFQSLLNSLSKHYNFSLNEPIKNMEHENISLILYGTRNEKINIEHISKKGQNYNWLSEFEGVIPGMERRYINTESDKARQDVEKYMLQKPCISCNGQRLKPEALSVKILGMNIMEVTNLSIENCINWLNVCKNGNSLTLSISSDLLLTKKESSISEQILKEIESRLYFLSQVGLNYLSLSRTASTLSGGEGQRIRLATQIGSGLMGVLYVCDEPSVGLHPSDNEKLIKTLKNLRDVGNTVLIVEHDESIMRSADHIIDLGPGAGEYGGNIIAEGNIKSIEKNKESITGNYLSGIKKISTTKNRRSGNKKKIRILGANENNLQNISVDIPLGCFISITGVSGSGKSTLINEILSKKLSNHFYKSKEQPGKHISIEGIENIDKIINIDQSPIGRTPRSNPATYTGLFTYIRELFSAMPEAKARGYKPGRFSFNVKGGRCESCSGAGYMEIEMQFLPDVTVPCEYCKGDRYNREALEIKFKNKSISDVLNMTASESSKIFENISPVKNKLKILNEVGLGYIKLGQPATTLSGGEAQRIKLASELSKRSTGNTLYVLDEPTTGLSFDDVNKLLSVIQKLADKGNTIILIEHNIDLIKCSDWIIDLGPGAGDKGGHVVAQGTPEYISSVKKSETGKHLAQQKSIKPNPKASGTTKMLISPKKKTQTEKKLSEILNTNIKKEPNIKIRKRSRFRNRRRKKMNVPI